MMELTEKDREKLAKIREYLREGTADTLYKSECLQYIEDILCPKCSVCRGAIGEGEMVVVNQRKMHVACQSKYKAK